MARPLAIALMVALALAGSLPAMPARAGDGVNHAGVIVRQADGSFVYGYVAFTEEKIDGLELLRRSGIPLVTAGFGGLGEAVCSLDGAGCDMAECRKSVCQRGPNSPYWQYFRQDSAGEWKPRLTGASGTTVHDGDIEGWSWTAKDAALPAMTLPQLAALAGADPGLEPGDDARAAAWRRTGGGPESGRHAGSPVAYIAAGGILAILGGAAAAAIRRRTEQDAEAA